MGCLEVAESQGSQEILCETTAAQKVKLRMATGVDSYIPSGFVASVI